MSNARTAGLTEEETVRNRLFAIYRVLLGGITVTVMTLLLAPLVILVSLFTSSPRPTYVIARTWIRVVAAVLGVTSSISGEEKTKPGTSYIVTPNHQGNADILAIYSKLPMPYLWVLKKELVRIPLFGWALSRTGAVCIDRSNPGQAVRQLQQGSKTLPKGWSLLIYPEGTRSPDGGLQKFKKGAFMLAVQTGLPILPVTVNGAFPILPKRTLVVRPGHITVTICDPIPTEGLTVKDVPALMQRTRKAVADKIDPTYDPFDPASRAAAAHKQAPA